LKISEPCEREHGQAVRCRFWHIETGTGIAMCRYADGVVVGSALLRGIENEKSIDGVVASAGAFLSSLQEDSQALFFAEIFDHNHTRTTDGFNR